MAGRWHRRREGQTLVLFVLALVVLIGGAGMVLDLGGAWAQQRNEQRVADLAALAGATSEANGGSRTQIIAAAVASAQANGFSSSEVQVNIPPTQGRYGPGGIYYGSNDCSTSSAYPCAVEIVVNRAHQNSFASIMGMPSWPVTARGVAIGGIANSVVAGASPLMFNQSAVEPGTISTQASPQTYCNPSPSNCPGNDPVPLGPDQFTYTVFCLGNGSNCNVDSSTAVALLTGGNLRAYPTISIGMSMGPNNAGQHTGVCHDLSAYVGQDLAVAIVTGSGKDGTLVGYWMFHLSGTSCQGSAGEQIDGYFVSDITDSLPLTLIPGGGRAIIGEFIVRLVE